MPEKGISPRSGGTGENPIHIREHLGQKNEDELFEAVWDELEHSEDGADVDVDKILTYMYIMDDINPLPDLDLSSSWNEFEEKYGPVTDGPEPAKQQLPASDSPAKNKRRHHRVKPIRALLVVLCVSVMLVISSSCGVIDYIINVVVRWTDATFGFNVISTIEEDTILPKNAEVESFSSLENAMDSFNFNIQNLPTWYPYGFIFFNVKVSESANIVKLKADYTKRKQQLAISIWRYKDNQLLDFRSVEKDPSIVEEYIHSGVTYYIMKNNLQVNVVWVLGEEVYTIGGDLSIEDAKKMIDSIYRG